MTDTKHGRAILGYASGFRQPFEAGSRVTARNSSTFLATVSKFRIVRLDGSRQAAREIEHYSLPVILAVGYRLRSPRGTQFRQWATARLSEYLVKRSLTPPKVKQIPATDRRLTITNANWPDVAMHPTGVPP